MSVAYAKRIGARFAAFALVLTLGAGLVISSSARAADPIGVVLDEARLVKVPERATTIVLGNPLVADVAIQPGGVMIVTGKGHGSTSLTVLDRSGTVVLDRMIEVTAQTDKIVTVHRGIERYTYACTPDCQPRVMLGDSNEYYGQTLAQIMARGAAAAAAAAMSQPQSPAQAQTP